MALAKTVWRRAIVRRFVLLPALLVFGLAGCNGTPEGVRPITGFDAGRYMGTWYEIARLDHSFERGLSHVTAAYKLLPDGSVEVINRGLDAQNCEWSEAQGNAVFLGDPQTASLSVTFFWPFSGGYHVFDLDDDYSNALVSGPDYSYFWLLSRTPVLAPDVQQALLDKAEAVGFDLADVILVEQGAHDCE